MKRSRAACACLIAAWAAACGSSDSDPGGQPDASTGGDAGVDADLDGSAPDAVADALPDAADAASDGSDAAPGWNVPDCTSVTGTGAVTFTSDDGATLAPTSGLLSGTVYTRGLVALDVDDVLLAASGGDLLRSEDAGCTWQTVASLPSGIMTLVRGVGDRAFGYHDNDVALVRIDAGVVLPLKSPAPNVIGLGTDATEPDRLRLAGSDGSLWESTDAGASFSPLDPAPVAPLTYRFAFDPRDLDHILFGSASIGAWVSFDGGKQWAQATGLSASGKANAFEVVVSPIDSSVVWAQGIDLDENLANAPNEGRHIFRSDDGGKTFSRVVDHEPGVVTLTNGVLMAPSPADASVMYFVFGTYFGDYGTDLFRYDAGTKQLTKTHNAYDDVSSIAFSPADPGLLYLGLTQEQIL